MDKDLLIDDFLGRVKKIELTSLVPFHPVELNLPLEKVEHGVITLRLLLKPAGVASPLRRLRITQACYQALDRDHNKYIKIDSFIVFHHPWAEFITKGATTHNSDSNHALPDHVNEKCEWPEWVANIDLPFADSYAPSSSPPFSTRLAPPITTRYIKDATMDISFYKAGPSHVASVEITVAEIFERVWPFALIFRFFILLTPYLARSKLKTISL